MKKNRTFIFLIFTVIFYVISGQTMTKTVMAAENMSREMSITVSPSEGAKKLLEELAPEYGTLVYDLYKMADTKTKDNGLEVSFLAKYQSLKADYEAKNWDAMAQMAIKQTIGEEMTKVNEPKDATYTGISLDSRLSITPGLYLLIARGTKTDSTIITKVTKSKAEKIVSMDEISYENELATTTLLGINTFCVMPQLVLVPNKNPDNGEWLYDQNITLKMEEDPATGSIEIEKTLLKYYGNEENATFVFQVDIYFPTEDVLFKSEVYAMQFTKAGTKKLRIDGLPLGATIKIMEVYSGLNYEASIKAPDSLNLVVKADEIPTAHFTNDYNGNKSGGGGVTNYFKYDVTDGIGKWKWEQHTDNTETQNGLPNKFYMEIKGLTDKEKAD